LNRGAFHISHGDDCTNPDFSTGRGGVWTQNVGQKTVFFAENSIKSRVSIFFLGKKGFLYDYAHFIYRMETIAQILIFRQGVTWSLDIWKVEK